MDEDFIPTARIRSILFGLYSTEDVEKLSALSVTKSQSFNEFGFPKAGGLYDPKLGPSDDKDHCHTCSLIRSECPGHLGHIKLPMPVYNPFLFRILVKLLNGFCFECKKLRIPPLFSKYLIEQMQLLEDGSLSKLTITNDFNLKIKESETKNDNDSDSDNDITVLQNFNMGNVSKNISTIKKYLQKCFLRGNFFESKCPYCETDKRTLLTEYNSKIFFAPTKKSKNKKKTKVNNKEAVLCNGEKNSKAIKKNDFQAYLMPSNALEYLKALWINDNELLKYIITGLGISSADVFIMNCVPVTPPKMRPVGHFGDEMYEHEQTVLYSKIILCSDTVQSIFYQMREDDECDISEKIRTLVMHAKGNTLPEKLQNSLVSLQQSVNVLLDSSLDKTHKESNRGIKQMIEKKQGFLRMNMMGKRVNYAARTVISPDPYLHTNEIGIPFVFATKLTYPEYVTPNNFRTLKDCVLRGPNCYPGATHIVDEKGITIRLSNRREQRESLANQLLKPLTSVEAKHSGKSEHKRVYRHLRNGDILLLNRQPSLHRPSIQAHRARILPNEKTFRLHYSNCKAYNADFDGDEMNAHFPQNEMARAEAYNLVSTNKQFTVPKDGSPLGGLIQDHIVSGVKLTGKGRFFTRQEYQQLITSALSDYHRKYELLPPALFKPVNLWTGKQVISTIILNTIPSNKNGINLVGSSKIYLKDTDDLHLSESHVVFHGGELLIGILDKAHYGPTKYGLIHCINELYGGEIANNLLSRFGRLFTVFLQTAGFTLGIADITCKTKSDIKRRKILNKRCTIDLNAASRALEIKITNELPTLECLTKKYEEAHFNNVGIMKDLDLCMKQSTDDINTMISKLIMPFGLYKQFPDNNLQLMVESGAKGSKVNCLQISCLLGQIELEGRRPPLMLSGKSLPSFKRYDFSPGAGGFVAGRFLTGINPKEYFFHCMAGREGLIDTAVKTSRSGYLQRCLIKHLEGLCVNYDLTVRDHDKSIIQFYYGEDGLDINKVQFFGKSQLKLYRDNLSALFDESIFNEIQAKMNCEKARKHWKKVLKYDQKSRRKMCAENNNENIKKRSSAILEFSKMCDEIKHFNETLKNNSPFERFCLKNKNIMELWLQQSEPLRKKILKSVSKQIDPAMSKYKPDCYLGSVSENFYSMLNSFILENESIKKNDYFRLSILALAQKALVEPGEAVGALAAQSIGEPSTQMTLNTFHFAGRGEMNVTLGIPRLREILMTATANIKTPMVSIPILNTDYAQKNAEKLRLQLTRVNLRQVIEKMAISDKIVASGNVIDNYRMITIKVDFLPRKLYKKDCFVKSHYIKKYMEKFWPRIAEVIKTAVIAMSPDEIIKTSKVVDVKQLNADECDENNIRIDDDDNDGDDDEDRIKKLKLEDDNALDDNDDDDDDDEDDDEILLDNLPVKQETETIEKTEKLNAKEIFSYTYDPDNYSWCQVVLKLPLESRTVDVNSLIEDEIQQATLYKCNGIERAFLKANQAGVNQLSIEGINLPLLYAFNRILDLNLLYTNDIMAVCNKYGIEAAYKVIIKEIQNVFGLYGITVNYRHLSLIADYMTFEGNFNPFNRSAMEASTSPFQRMSFETSIGMLKTAVISGERDMIISPSARICCGKLINIGSGIFDTIYKPLKL